MVNTTMRIRRARVGLTQAELAAKLGITRATISMIENGRFNPSLRIIKGLMRELESTFDDLFGNY